jgi:hypothetical protein
MRSYKYEDLKSCFENFDVKLSPPAEIVEEHEGTVLYVRPTPLHPDYVPPKGYGGVVCYQCADGTVQLARLKKSMGGGIYSVHTDHGTLQWLDGQVATFKHGYETNSWYVLAPENTPRDRWVSVLRQDGARKVLLGRIIRPKGLDPGRSQDFHRALFQIHQSEIPHFSLGRSTGGIDDV